MEVRLEGKEEKIEARKKLLKSFLFVVSVAMKSLINVRKFQEQGSCVNYISN